MLAVGKPGSYGFAVTRARLQRERQISNPLTVARARLQRVRQITKPLTA